MYTTSRSEKPKDTGVLSLDQWTEQHEVFLTSPLMFCQNIFWWRLRSVYWVGLNRHECSVVQSEPVSYTLNCLSSVADVLLSLWKYWGQLLLQVSYVQLQHHILGESTPSPIRTRTNLNQVFIDPLHESNEMIISDPNIISADQPPSSRTDPHFHVWLSEVCVEVSNNIYSYREKCVPTKFNPKLVIQPFTAQSLNILF